MSRQSGAPGGWLSLREVPVVPHALAREVVGGDPPQELLPGALHDRRLIRLHHIDATLVVPRSAPGDWLRRPCAALALDGSAAARDGIKVVRSATGAEWYELRGGRLVAVGVGDGRARAPAGEAVVELAATVGGVERRWTLAHRLGRRTRGATTATIGFALLAVAVGAHLGERRTYDGTVSPPVVDDAGGPVADQRYVPANAVASFLETLHGGELLELVQRGGVWSMTFATSALPGEAWELLRRSMWHYHVEIAHAQRGSTVVVTWRYP